MWLSLTAFSAVCVLLVETVSNHEMDKLFQLRTPGEWEREWHQERYSRCRDSITTHMRWACEKDIYKLKRSEARDIFAVKRAEMTLTPNAYSFQEEDEEGPNEKRNDYNSIDEQSPPNQEGEDDDEKYPWLGMSNKWALGMLRAKRGRSKRAGVITKECCSAKGCTWEEYAEYCTQNNRKVPQHKRYDYVIEY